MSETTYYFRVLPNLPFDAIVNAVSPCGVMIGRVASVHEMNSPNPVIKFHVPIGIRGVEKIVGMVRYYQEAHLPTQQEQVH